MFYCVNEANAILGANSITMDVSRFFTGLFLNIITLIIQGKGYNSKNKVVSHEFLCQLPIQCPLVKNTAG
jgi:hypothetical protein